MTDHVELVPNTTFDDARLLEFDFPVLKVGVATYEAGPTGCTVFYFPDKALVAIDVRGGNPSITSTDGGVVDAICFAGGSHGGKRATEGIVAELNSGRSGQHAATVRGAMIYDYHGRSNHVHPDEKLGQAALKAARSGVFPLGCHGVGRQAGCGPGFDDGLCSEPTGQGGAFRQMKDTKIAVFTVVNALGAIVDRQGHVVRGHWDERTKSRVHYSELVERSLAKGWKTATTPGNTTLSLMVTNQKLSPDDLLQVARQVHVSMARAIQPFHTKDDGDILFAATTNEVEGEFLDPVSLGVVASELAWDAVLNTFE